MYHQSLHNYKLFFAQVYISEQNIGAWVSRVFARPSRALSPVATVPELLLSCVILGKFYLALFVELANRIFSQFIKT